MSEPVPLRPTGGEVLVEALLARGVDTLFGLPGLQLDPLFNALHGARDRLRVINARHEQGVAYMALGYAQATGRPGVYAAVPGPGFLNTTAALSTAYALHAPVLALIGQIRRASIGRGAGELHELPDQSAILRGLTRWSGLADDGAALPGLVADAFACLTAARGPAGIELPADVLSERAPAADCPGIAPADALPSDVGAIRQAAALLAGAKAPMIVVGGGAVGAAEAIRVLAERLGAPVLSHLTGRGLLPDAHPLSIGRDVGVRLWPDTDVVLAIGTRFNGPRRRWGLRPDQVVIRIDHDQQQQNRNDPATIALVADAALMVPALDVALAPSRREGDPARAEALARLKADSAARFAAELAPQMAWIDALSGSLPIGSVLVCDYTQVAYVATAAYPLTGPRQLITPGYQGTLGFAFATALGAKIGRPDVPVVALVGDGGFLFTAAELATAVQYGISVITIVFNDGHYGNVKRMQDQDHGGKVIASALTNPDFVRFAESFGAGARRAADPAALRDALRWALRQDGPTVIEVPVGAMPSPWSLLEPSGPVR